MANAPALLDARGRTAVVFGGAGGIGRATVELFLAAGASAVVADRDARRLPRRGARRVPLVCDATIEDEVDHVLAEAHRRFGALDYVVNAVGITGVGRLDQMSLADWRRVIDVNLTSAFLIARAAYRRMRRPGGVLILISSTNGRTGGTLLSGAAYGAAKAGVLNLARYLAKEWAPDGLRVNVLAPGPVDTPMLDRLSSKQHAALRAALPLNRYATAEEVAATIGFLCSRHAASVTGACANVSSGLVLD
jgi:NAD(P)-dependent dehydrogenase (short-subunit alcohol dehydrogenase family)